MAEVLEYKYHPGDVLRYRYTVTAVLEQPEDETFSLTCSFNGRFAVLEIQEVEGERLFSLELRLDPVEVEGMLRELIGRELANQVVCFQKPEPEHAIHSRCHLPDSHLYIANGYDLGCQQR